MAAVLLLGALAGEKGTAFAAGGEPAGNAASAPTVLIRHVDVWDGESDAVRRDQCVLVRGPLIEAVGPALDAPLGSAVIDGQGHTLIPGLSDAHRHLMINLSLEELRNVQWGYPAARAVKSAEVTLMMGFTTVRDMGGPVFGLQKVIDDGTFAGPRIYPSGAMVSQTAGHGDLRERTELDHRFTGGTADWFQLSGWSYIVDGRPEVLHAVRENLRQGATQIKMMAGGGITSPSDPLHTVQFTEEELRAGVEAASDWGTYVAVHAYNSTSILRALEAGVKSIEHGQLMDEAAMRSIKEHDAFLVPQVYWVERDPATARNPDKFLEAQRGVVREMELARQYGVKLAFGTDVFGPLGIEPMALKEFTARAHWFAPVDILRQATSVNGQLFALSGDLNPYPEGPLGVIQPGAYADLLIYDGNPLDDISVVTRPDQTLKLIMKGGVVYKNTLGEEAAPAGSAAAL